MKERDKLIPVRGTLNIDKAKDILQYAPIHPIERGISYYYDWYAEMIYGDS